MRSLEEQKILNEHLARARLGPDVWNKWAKENPDAEVDFSHYNFIRDPIPFNGFIFRGDLSFEESTFNNVNFNNTKFIGEVDFTKVHFIGEAADFGFAEFSIGAANFSKAEFHCDVTYFKKVKFNGRSATFHKAEFNGLDNCFINARFDCGEINFDNAIFNGEIIDFTEVKFKGNDASFIHAKFRGGPTKFEKANFSKKANFSGASFDYPVYMEGAVFAQVPDFRRSTLKAHFTLHKMTVKWEPKLGKKDPDAEDKFRRLKELAISSKDHDRELEFFACEMKAKALHTSKIWRKLLISSYDILSDFGRSMKKPFGGLFITWIIFAFIFGAFACFNSKNFWDFFEGPRLSLAILTSFMSTSRTTYGEARDAVFGDVAPWADFLIDLSVGIEAILGLAFIFLIGLAFRNRFRL